MGFAGVCFLLLMGSLRLTDSEMISVTAREGMTINIKQAPGGLQTSDCKICITEEECYDDYQVNPGNDFEFDFSCSDPEQNFVAEVQINIESEEANLTDAVNLPELPQLNRTYIWDITVPYKVGVHMSFEHNHLEQIDSVECEDSLTYTIKGHLRSEATSAVLVGNFCRNGTISNVKVQGRTVVMLKVPWTEPIDGAGFQLFFVLPIGKFSVINVNLQPGFPASFMSADWPDGFPNDELMSWQFSIPSNYHANVTYETLTFPQCIKRKADVYTSQPVIGKMEGKHRADFVLVLQNCDMDQTSPQVLTFRFRVDLLQHRESYEIKVSEGDSMIFKQISETAGVAFPLLCICTSPELASNCGTELRLEGGDHMNVSFNSRCDPTRDVIVEATRNISCKDVEECSVNNVDLALPTVLSTLPVARQTFKWVLTQPSELTIELASEHLKLQQLLQDDKCEGNLMYNVSTFSQDGARSVVGQFCPNGAMERIQTADHVLLELRTSHGWDSKDQDVKLSFIPRLTEDYIMNIIPEVDSPVRLLSPNWGPGMPNRLTASWNISVPPDHVAELTFMEQLIPTCERGHVTIVIIEQISDGVHLSYRESDTIPELVPELHHRFWLNVSNCETSNGQLSLMFQVLVREDSMDIITIAAAVAGGVVLLIVIAVIICCVRQRKRQQQLTALGTYYPGVSSRKPGQRRKFVKGRQDNESHIYAVIDEDRIYADYLNKSGMSAVPEVDVYRSFDGPMGEMPPSLPPPRGTVSKDTRPEGMSMVSNDLYTFSVRKQDVEKSILDKGEQDSSS
ncbi:CUB domain-containing protein 1a [Chiloscyllium punctatum]|uniref:CUB domain-containing protein 1a n=1 Tax=Chiloscyllium punctatum TaxID=137246 RepID=UPI003B63682F